jgi:hypothetical protein
LGVEQLACNWVLHNRPFEIRTDDVWPEQKDVLPRSLIRDVVLRYLGASIASRNLLIFAQRFRGRNRCALSAILRSRHGARLYS